MQIHHAMAGLSVDALAAHYAELAEHDRELEIDSRALAAIRKRRIDELVLWQRVRFRARLLRAVEQRQRHGDRAGRDCPAMSQSFD